MPPRQRAQDPLTGLAALAARDLSGPRCPRSNSGQASKPAPQLNAGVEYRLSDRRADNLTKRHPGRLSSRCAPPPATLGIASLKATALTGAIGSKDWRVNVLHDTPQ